MDQPIVSPKRRPPWLIATIVFIVAFDLAFAWQHLARTYSSELGGHPDEAAHYLDGQMMCAYATRGFGTAPAKFAEVFRRSYPSAHPTLWPPLFPIVEAAWTVPFGQARTSALLLMAGLATVAALLLFRALQVEYGAIAAGVAAAVFLSLPLTREYSALIMPEMLAAVLMFAAALAFGRYLDSEKTAAAVGCGLLATLAILTTTSGLALLVMVPLALLLTGQWFLLARPAFWSAIALPALLAGPWAWRFRTQGGVLSDWIQPSPSFDFTREALPFYLAKFALAGGFVFGALVFVGLAVKLLRPAARTGRCAAAAALMASVILFPCALPFGLEARHLLPAIPAATMFAVAGSFAVATRFRRGAEILPPILLLVAWLAGSVLTASNQHKIWTGFRPLAEIVLADQADTKRSVLVASDRTGEGMFVSEMAMAEKRPGRTIELASRVLVERGEGGRRPRAKFLDDEDLAAFLKTGEFQYIVVDDSLAESEPDPQHDLLKRVLREDTEHFWEVAASPIIRGGVPQDGLARLYRVLGRN